MRLSNLNGERNYIHVLTFDLEITDYRSIEKFINKYK